MLPEEIKAYVKARQFFHCQTNLNTIFSWKELEKLLNLRQFMRTSRFKFFQNDQYYNWDMDYWTRDPECPTIEVIETIIQNSFCLIYECNRVNQHIANICKDLDEITHGTADAHLFFTVNPKYQGLGAHTDSMDVMIVQIEGISEIELEHYGRLRTNPGDVLFIPKKTEHNFISMGPRLSISFPILEEISTVNRNWISLKI